MLYEEIDNTAWSGRESENSELCRTNRVYDEITEAEIEIWLREDSDDGEPVRLNGKYVWQTVKRVCDFRNAHEDLIHMTSFGEYREVMKKVMMVIRETHNTERKRRRTVKKRRKEKTKKKNAASKDADRHHKERRNRKR